MKYVVGCDIGSQSLKVLLISEEGKTCGEASISYPIDYPQPTWAEQSANSWIEALAQAMRALLADPEQNIPLEMAAFERRESGLCRSCSFSPICV